MLCKYINTSLTRFFWANNDDIGICMKKWLQVTGLNYRVKPKTIINNQGNWGNVSRSRCRKPKRVLFKSINLKKLFLLKNLSNRCNMIQLQKETAYLPPSCSLLRETVVKILSQYNTTIQILLSTPHGGFSETSINSTGNQK